MSKPKKKPSRATPRARALVPATTQLARDDLREIYAVIASIPRGKVVTYGEVADMVGRPNGHRFVAKAMRTCPKGLPWQRVVGRRDARRAKISIQDPSQAAVQRKLLEKEGVVFDDTGSIVMARSGWMASM
jgi:methylated-DNA-protein-cysteine methyltransferase-like protein